MSSTSGRVRHDPDAELPFVVTLTRAEGEPTEHGFATMREAEASSNATRRSPAARFRPCTTVLRRTRENPKIFGEHHE